MIVTSFLSHLFFFCNFLLTLIFSDSAISPRSPLPAPKNGSVYVIAHRGAHQHIPENTRPAYAKAIEFGIDFIEIDVRTTADSHWVSVHNSTLASYVDNDRRLISEMTLKEIQSVDVGKRVGEQWQGTRIPSLEEIVDLCKGRCGIYLDLKNADIPKLAAYLRAKGMMNSVLWYVDATEPALQSAANTFSDCLFMPDPGPEKNLLQLFSVYRPAVVATVWEYCSASFVQTCHQRGALVFMDEDRPEDWAKALAWGVDGIQTDDPEGLITYLKKKQEEYESQKKH
jgi:glycerophosphoryl diester phosphodiesterase